MVNLETKKMLQIMPSRIWCDKFDFLSGDSEWKLALYDPQEWRMGVDGWQGKLHLNDAAVSDDHPIFEKIVSGKGRHNAEK